MPPVSVSPDPSRSGAPLTDSAAVLVAPALLPLLPLAGVLLTVIAGLVLAGIQGAREHKKWVRETRYEAYVRFLRIGRAHILYGAEMDSAAARLNQLEAELEEALARSEAVTTTTEAGETDAKFVQLKDDFDRTTKTYRAHEKAYSELRTETVDASAAFMLLGPNQVHSAVESFTKAESIDAKSRALSGVEKAMRAVLRVKF